MANLALGNVRLNKKATGVAYDKIENDNEEKERSAQSVVRGLDIELKKVKGQIAELRKEAVSKAEVAEGNDRAEYEKIINELDAQSAGLVDIYYQKYVKSTEDAGKATEKRTRAKTKHGQIKQEQVDVAKDPYGLATENVLSAYRAQGKDYSAGKEAIKALAEEMGRSLGKAQEAREELPVMEEYAEGINSELSSIQQELKRRSAEFENELDDFRKTEISPGVKDAIKRLKLEIEEALKPRWFGKDKASRRHKDANESMDRLKKELLGKVDKLYPSDLFTFIYEKRTKMEPGGLGKPGELSESEFKTHIPNWTTRAWMEAQQKYPKFFTELSGRISDLAKQVESVEFLRKGVYNNLDAAVNDTNRKITNLREEVDGLFTQK